MTAAARLYLMAGALHRPFDNPEFREDGTSVLGALRAVISGDAELLLAYPHFLDTTSFELEAHTMFMRLARDYALLIAPAPDIEDLASTLRQAFDLTAQESLHVACAAYRGATHFVTPDPGLILRQRDFRRVTGPGLTFLAPKLLQFEHLSLAAEKPAKVKSAASPVVVAEESGPRDDVLDHAEAIVQSGTGQGDWHTMWVVHSVMTPAEYTSAARLHWPDRPTPTDAIRII